MPRFYISCEGAQEFEDEDGTDLSSLAEARLQAIVQSGEIMRDHAREFAQAAWWRVTVRDHAKRIVMVLNLDLEFPDSAGSVEP